MAWLSSIGWLACVVLIINLSTLAEAAESIFWYNQPFCTKARAGYYVAKSGATSELACKQGTFNSVQGATGCCSCCAGWFNNKYASTSCQKCPTRSPYSPPGATSCTPWKGLYAPLPRCYMDGRNCPITFIDDPSSAAAPIRRSEPGIPTCTTPRERACPVYRIRNGVRTQIGHKCQVISNDLWSCGGCPNDDREEYSGKDCTEIRNADSVQCIKGQCVVHSCIAGHTRSEDHAACISMAAHEGLVEQSLPELTKDWDLY
ncbi:hypothetical protein PC9H_010646 [Pleurotus ostreatus]|uniref:Protein CPL1-like domain-containing protein n=1 Tax=Pleurotus ostreatus TaxID=5322 RepID=A0A8H7DPX4_PLEOS|nr:uncharacterized protein PC9H_010646 [Pleurotus ostreatus]KAF7422490.1 hypothetical protein PC9H_010646 [Pleurotus ostreatus]